MVSQEEKYNHLCQQANSLLQQDKAREALRICDQLCSQYCNRAPGWYMAGIAAQKLGDLGKAIEYTESALTKSPQENIYKIRLAHLLLAQGMKSKAIKLIKYLNKPEALDASLCADIGEFYVLANDYQNSLKFFIFVTKDKPDNVGNWFNYANTLRHLGQFQQAEIAYDEVLQRNPKYAEAYYLRSGLHKQTRTDNHIQQLHDAFSNEKTNASKVPVCYALGKEYEDLGQHQKSFSWIKRGAQSHRHSFSYDVQEDIDTVNEIISKHSRKFITKKHQYNGNQQPIFIVGLPRSGTTLVDRILSSHEDVISAGELNHFAVAMIQEIRNKDSKSTSKIDAVNTSLKIDFEKLGDRYINLCAEFSDIAPRHFIDKMPLNFLYCGLIAKALPNAKIIELVRHPLDVIYAMYKQLFVSAYPFSYDLNELADYYLAYCRLMHHWHKIIPGKIHRMYYEDLVNSQKTETERLLTHCELSWQERCFKFEENSSPTTTASAVQVRQSMYRSSLGKWKSLRNELKPVIAHLSPYESLWHEDGRYNLD